MTEDEALVGGRFRVLRKLGSLRSGDAYEATDTTDGALVVLKVLSYASVGEPKEIELFERQIQILGALDHPGVPKARVILRTEWQGERALVIALERLQGESLEALLEAGLRLDETRARRLLEGLLGILEHLHSRSPSILHRDIKAGNVLLGPHDAPALVDFDTAREAGAQAELSYETFVASAGYAPPEQVQGRSRPASDLYALGVTLVAALSRRHPTEIPVEGLRLRFEPYVNVSDEFTSVLRRLIEPDVDKRFQSVAEVRAALVAPEVSAVAGAVPQEKPAAWPARKVFTWGASLFTIVLAIGWLRRTPEGKQIMDASDALARGPETGLFSTAQSWSPTREELAACRVQWARSVVASSAPVKVQQVVGPPDHYRVPDRGLNEWAQRTWSAPTGEQWVTIAFEGAAADELPEAQAILLVEASTKAGVARVDDLTDPAKPVAVWRGRLSGADSWDGERILRIDLPKRRRIRTLRVFLDIPRFDSNPIDAIGLLVSEPSPQRPPAPGRASEWEPPAGSVAPDGVAWAASVLSRSMEQRDWGHQRILGPPDAFPKHDGSQKAWAPHTSPPGRRWIAVSFGGRHSASAVLVYESYHPGAVVRLEELTDREDRSAELADPVVVWEGHLPVLGKDEKPLPFPCWSERGRVLRIDLPGPRTISALRLVLDTGKGCYSQIDAVGLVLAFPRSIGSDITVGGSVTGRRTGR